MTAPRDRGDYVLHGEKTWISNGGIADVCAVFARSGEAPGAKGLSAFIVPAGLPGFEVVERLHTIAPHPLARLRFTDCRLPAAALLGQPGQGFRIAMSVPDVFRSTVAAAALGFSRRALDEALARVASRHVRGAPLSDLQMVQGHVADMALGVDAAAPLTYRASWTKDTGAARVTREAATAKLHATETAQKVIDTAVQLHGFDYPERLDAGAVVVNTMPMLRAAVSAGETLPKPICDEWMEKTGKPVLDRIGSTDMLHNFINNRFADRKPGCTGKPVGGYEARVIGPDGQQLPPGEMGRLAVRGPTGCRYLRGERQKDDVQDGWNVTGDAFFVDEDGDVHFAARNDDIIASSGYTIAGPEVEAALLPHPAVTEWAVIGVPDEDRGAIVQAPVVIGADAVAGDRIAKILQDHVKATIAPHKHPRAIVFTTALPKTESGKIQQFRQRDMT